MNKPKLYYYLKVIQSLKTWQLVVILLIMLLVSATFLRLNNLGMSQRRAAVAEADKSGNRDEIRQSLQQLRKYVNSHMNTDLGSGVYLQQSYNRDRDAALKKAADTTNPGSAAYQQASIECRSRFAGGTDSFRNDYVQCVIDRVGAMTQANDPGAAGLNLPKAENYRYDFVSPKWSADFAGFSVLFTLLIFLVILARVLLLAIARAMLKTHYRRLNS